jgi:L-ascorbate metabolism protein UlaG (beta-lactamase superfamily)
MKKPWHFLLIFVPALFFLFSYSSYETDQMSFTYNPDLPTVNKDSLWKGTPMDGTGKFVNLHDPFESSFKDFLKWQLSTNPQKAAKKGETRIPVVVDGKPLIAGEDDFIMWLGHASYLIRLNNQVILIDPLLFDNFFLKRDHALPLQPEDFPEVDYLLISHNHRDHCDEKSIKYIAERNPDMKILTGLGLGNVIKSWLAQQEVQEAGWFQQYRIEDGVEITYLPTRHWSKRGLRDDNTSLWGGFFIKVGDQSIYFMGDSGKGAHFEEIKVIMGNPNYCLMGVGAFKPEWFMHQSHINPTDAIAAFNTLGGRFFIPMHFGTFDLSDEPRMEPLDILLENRKSINGVLIEPVAGQNLMLNHRTGL